VSERGGEKDATPERLETASDIHKEYKAETESPAPDANL
jgi:hypothetical protein